MVLFVLLCAFLWMIRYGCRNSVYSSGSKSNITFAEASSPVSVNKSTELLEQTQMTEEEASALKSSTPSSQSNSDEVSDADQQVSAEAVIVSNDDCLPKASDDEQGEITEFKVAAGDEAVEMTANDVSQPLVENLDLKSWSKEPMRGKIEVRSDESSLPTETQTRVTRGKNAYAMSVLKCMEMKIDGRNIADNREVSIPEQVDYLIKQATSVDNLCNMYEGWTPWI